MWIGKETILKGYILVYGNKQIFFGLKNVNMDKVECKLRTFFYLFVKLILIRSWAKETKEVAHSTL